MNDQELITKIHSSMYQQCQKRGYATPVDVLIDIGYLTKENYEKWRNGRTDYLERVCTANLKKLSTVLSLLTNHIIELTDLEGFSEDLIERMTFLLNSSQA